MPVLVTSLLIKVFLHYKEVPQMLTSDKHSATFNHVNYSVDGIHKKIHYRILPWRNHYLFSRAFGSVKEDITPIMQWAPVAWFGRFILSNRETDPFQLRNNFTAVYIYLNPYTHKECDHMVWTQVNLPWYFNPRTHEECVRGIYLEKWNVRISIHAPPRSAT